MERLKSSDPAELRFQFLSLNPIKSSPGREALPLGYAGRILTELPVAGTLSKHE